MYAPIMDPRVEELLSRLENRSCADCGKADPRWCNVVIGVAICTDCAYIHRKLDPHLSLVQSAASDSWQEEWMQLWANFGNAKAAELYEAGLPSSWARPQVRSIKEQFIRAKYEHKAFASREAKVLDHFYSGLRLKHLQDRHHFTKHKLSCSPARRNRQELYVNDLQRGFAFSASLKFMTSHPEWLYGPHVLTDDELIARIALQHFIAIDVEDLSLDAQMRRNDDCFETSHDEVCEQFLKDSTRSSFRICGEDFDFQREAETNEAVVDPGGMEQGAAEFTKRLVVALRQGLGGSPQLKLLRAASIILSQAGMARMEQASRLPPVVVSGGQHVVKYELEAFEPGAWKLHLAVQKAGFREAVVYANNTHGIGDASLPLPCQPSSVMAKSCTILLSVNDLEHIFVDVVSFKEEVKLLDKSGAPHDLTLASPLSDDFFVFLCRARPEEPLGLCPCKIALRRGVLKLKAGVAAETPAAEWNRTQREGRARLSEGDFLISVNGVLVTRDDACSSALKELKQSQVVLKVKRIRPGDVSLSYETLSAAAYTLFNPEKLNSLPELFSKNDAQNLFYRICKKYARNREDWQEIVRSFLWHEQNTPRLERAVARAEARLEDVKVGEELLLLKALCRHLLDNVAASGVREPTSEEGQQITSQPNNDHDHPAIAHLQWLQMCLDIHVDDPAAPLGLRHDRAALQQHHMFLIKEVLPQSPAEKAGLVIGDIVETIGGIDAVVVAQGGKEKTAKLLEDCLGILSVVLRRERKEPGEENAMLAFEIDLSV